MDETHAKVDLGKVPLLCPRCPEGKADAKFARRHTRSCLPLSAPTEFPSARPSVTTTRAQRWVPTGTSRCCLKNNGALETPRYEVQSTLGNCCCLSRPPYTTVHAKFNDRCGTSWAASGGSSGRPTCATTSRRRLRQHRHQQLQKQEQERHGRPRTAAAWTKTGCW